MCPDKEILSAFYDNEVPSPWKEKVAGLIGESDECKSVYGEFVRVSEFLHGDEKPDFSGLSEKVYSQVVRSVSKRKHNIFTGSITLPVPLVAAAGFVFTFLLSAFIFFTPEPEQIHVAVPIPVPQQVAPDLQVTVQVNNMEELLQVMNGEGDFEEVTIELPKKQEFSFIGEPVLLKSTAKGKVPQE